LVKSWEFPIFASYYYLHRACCTLLDGGSLLTFSAVSTMQHLAATEIDPDNASDSELSADEENMEPEMHFDSLAALVAEVMRANLEHASDAAPSSKPSASYVVNRHGKRVPVQFDVVTERIEELRSNPAYGPELSAIDSVEITAEVIKRFRNGMKTRELDIETVATCNERSPEHSDYDAMATRICVSDLHKRTPASLREMIRAIVDAAEDERSVRYSDEYIAIVERAKDAIDAKIDSSRDYRLKYLGFTTAARSYLIRPGIRTEESSLRDTQIMERPQHLYMREALGIFVCQPDGKGHEAPESAFQASLTQAFHYYDMISLQLISNATPTALNAGTKVPQLSSCFQSSVGDDLNDQYTGLRSFANISKWSGGVSIWIHGVRAEGAPIRGTNGTASGIGRYLRVLNDTQLYVNQGGNRPGAFVVYLMVDHDDIFSMLEAARIKGEGATNSTNSPDLKYALWVSNLFLDAVRAQLKNIENVVAGGIDDPHAGDWHLFDPDQSPGLHLVYGDEYCQLRARYIAEGRFRRCVKAGDIISEAFKTWAMGGTPYVLNKDHINLMSNMKNVAPIASSNLCVAGTALVLTRAGYCRIDGLADREVEVWNGAEWSRTVVRRTSDSSSLIRVKLDDGSDLDCTAYHKFYVHNESDKRDVGAESHVAREARAWELKIGDPLESPPAWPLVEGDRELAHAYTAGFFAARGYYTQPSKATRCRHPRSGGNAFCERHQSATFAGPWSPSSQRCAAQHDELRVRLNSMQRSLICELAVFGAEAAESVEVERLYGRCPYASGDRKNTAAVVHMGTFAAGNNCLQKDEILVSEEPPIIESIDITRCTSAAHNSSSLCAAIIQGEGENSFTVRLTDNLPTTTYRPLPGASRTWICRESGEVIDLPASTTISSRLEWLAGFCDGAGHLIVDPFEGHEAMARPPVAISIPSGDKAQLKVLRLMLQTLGCSPTIRPAHALLDGVHASAHELVIALFDLEMLIRLGFRTRWLDISAAVERAREVLPRRDPRPWRRVAKVSSLQDKQATYCFNEPRRHRGVFNGIYSGQCCEITIASWSEFDKDQFARFHPGNAAGGETGVCNLDAVALESFATIETKIDPKITYIGRPGARINFAGISAAGGLAVRALNRIIDLNYSPSPECNRSNIRHRPVGVGIMGLADILALVRVAWGSRKGCTIARGISAALYYGTTSESAALAEIEGPYSTFEGSPISQGLLQPDLWVQNGFLDPKWEEEIEATTGGYLKPSDWAALRARVRKGVRNAYTTAYMPTATTSNIAGQNECFEPYTTNLYTRKTLAGEFFIVKRHLMAELIELGLWDAKMQREIIAAEGSIQNIARIPKEVRLRHLTARQIHPSRYIWMAKAMSPFICQSMSLNYYGDKPNLPKLLRFLLEGQAEGLKTHMYYCHSRPASGSKIEIPSDTTAIVVPAATTEADTAFFDSIISPATPMSPKTCSLYNREACTSCAL
jgi:ribonucleotide reductase alpha subunit